MSTSDGYGYRYGRKWQVLHNSRTCDQDCWLNDLAGYRHWLTSYASLIGFHSCQLKGRQGMSSLATDRGLCGIFFLARDSVYAIARSLLTPVRLSVPLSVTRVDQSKTVQDRITQSSPQCSPMTLVSSRGMAPWNSNGKLGSGVAKCERGMKKGLSATAAIVFRFTRRRCYRALSPASAGLSCSPLQCIFTALEVTELHL